MTASDPTPEALLEHGDFVRALARSLVADEQRAEDLVQESFLAAVLHPPRSAEALRPWLARVVRNAAANLLRGEDRRGARERLSARGERVDSALEVSQRIETQRRLLDGVRGLNEAYRTAIYLRFYEDLPPRAIAARLGIPVETARSRIRRGLEQLRAQLDREHGGDGRAWALALAPLAAPRGGAATASAAPRSAALAGAKAAALVAVAVGIGLALRALPGDDAPRPPTPSTRTAPALAGAANASAATQPLPDAPARHALGAAAQPSAPAAGASIARGRVTDAHTGEPVPALRVRLTAADGARTEVLTAPDGTFSSAEALPRGTLAVQLLDGNPPLPVESSPAHVEHGASTSLELSAAIGPTFRLPDELPRAVPREGWVFWLKQEGSPTNGGGDWRVPLRGDDEPWARLPAMPHLSLLEGGNRSGFLVGLYSRDLAWRAEARVDARPGIHREPLELRWRACGTIVGSVRDDLGAPIADALVELRERPGAPPVLHARAGDDGRFRLGPVPAGAWTCRASSPCHARAERAIVLAEGDEPLLELALTRLPSGNLSGTLTSASGSHVPRGTLRLVATDDPARVFRTEPVIDASGADATFRFEDVPTGAYQLLPPMGDHFAWEPAQLAVSVPAEGLSFRCLDDVPTCDVAFRVRDAASGEPIESFRGYLVVDRTGEGRARAIELQGPVPETVALRWGEPAFRGVPVDLRAHWLIEADGYCGVVGDERDFGGVGELRHVDLALRRTWSATLLIGTVDASGARIPLPGARVVTRGGSVLGSAHEDGTLALELSYDPGAIDVELDGWRLVGIEGFRDGVLVSPRELHFAHLEPR